MEKRKYLKDLFQNVFLKDIIERYRIKDDEVNTGDFFRKMVILDGSAKPWVDDEGITYVGVIPFLLED